MKDMNGITMLQIVALFRQKSTNYALKQYNKLTKIGNTINNLNNHFYQTFIIKLLIPNFYCYLFIYIFLYKFNKMEI